MASRGAHLHAADRGLWAGGRLAPWLGALLTRRVVARIEQGVVHGGVEAILPDGQVRRIGFHAPGPQATIHLHHWRALGRLATGGSVGWYQAWAKGEWSSPDPVPLFALFMANAHTLGMAARARGPFRWLARLAHRARDNHLHQARQNIAAHYDLGNDFYRAWLDPTMSYSSALFADGDDLEAAQRRKIEALLDRLQIQPGDRLLEIGCGWGSLALAAAERGARVVALTLSAEQQAWAEARIAAAGFSDRVEVRLQDYRTVEARFDAIASVEMVEAVGEAYWPDWFDALARCLRPGGRAAVQFISIAPDLFADYRRGVDFIQAYIFPGGCLVDEPSFARLAAERGLSWQDRHGFGLDYARTLRCWRDGYEAAVADGRIAGFAPEFHALWRYYLMYCEGGFRGGGIDVAQISLRRD